MSDIHDLLLVESYEKAVKLSQIDKYFILLLKKELERRGIQL
ncbi:sporulation histidine kinase inhibitor Sda [Bacillus sp. FJAT-45350]|nr:sporulation histidine kinase inhibitor Sda [Bacillus sp. FJAT-45350]